jgi:iron complex transport system substrate-binding protein
MDLRIFFILLLKGHHRLTFITLGTLQYMNVPQVRPHFTIKVFVHVMLIIFLSLPPVLSHAADFYDSLGRKVTVPFLPKRIVSLAPNITEMIYFLGLGDRLVGVTQFSSFPKEAQKKPKIGVYTGVNIEKVVILNPDLVIATADGNRKEDVEMLEEAGIPVYVVNPRRVYQVLDTIEKLGTLCGVHERAHHLVHRLRERVTKVIRAVRNRERPLILLVINVKPLISVNQSTIHHDIIKLAGGRNMTGDQPITYPRLSIEEVIKRRPDAIIISSMEREGAFEKARKEWFRWPALPAVQNGRVYLINSDLIDRAAPRIVTGLEKMARLLHPKIDWRSVHGN